MRPPLPPRRDSEKHDELATRRFVASRSIAADAASSVLLPASGQRVAVYLSAHATLRYSIAFGEAAAIDTGITVQATAPGVWLEREKIGEDITKEIRVFAAAAAVIGVLEVVRR